MPAGDLQQSNTEFINMTSTSTITVGRRHQHLNIQKPLGHLRIRLVHLGQAFLSAIMIIAAMRGRRPSSRRGRASRLGSLGPCPCCRAHHGCNRRLLGSLAHPQEDVAAALLTQARRDGRGRWGSEGWDCAAAGAGPGEPAGGVNVAGAHEPGTERGVVARVCARRVSQRVRKWSEGVSDWSESRILRCFHGISLGRNQRGCEDRPHAPNCGKGTLKTRS